MDARCRNILIFSLTVQYLNVMKILINYLLFEEGFPFLQHRCQNQTEHFIQTVTELHISLLNLIWYIYISQLKNSVKKAESSTIYQLISLGYSQWQMDYLGDRLTRFSVSVETGFRRSRKLRTPRRAAPDRPMNSLVRSASVMSVLPFSTK